MTRIVRVPVYHEGTFRAIVAEACRARSFLLYQGAYWEPIEAGTSFGLYRRAASGLRSIQERIESYEFSFYNRLLQEHCGRDGLLHPRARLRRRPNGAYCP